MWKSRLFWKLLAAYSALTLLSAAAFSQLVVSWLQVELQPHLAAQPDLAFSDSPEQLRWQAEMKDRIAEGVRYVWFVAGVVWVGSAAATYLVVRAIVAPIHRLTLAARSGAFGDGPGVFDIRRRDEIGELSDALETMRAQLAAQLSQLAETNRRLEAVLGGMAEGVLALDADRRVLFANVAAGRFLGFAPADVQGRKLFEVARHNKLQDAVSQAESRGPAARTEFVLEAPEPRTIEARATLFPHQDREGVILMLFNVTELRRLEAMRRDFVANVSHELKTPLANILAAAETLSCGAGDDPVARRQFVERIEEQAQRLHALIVDVLRLARIESGEQHFDLTRVDLAGIAADCLNDYALAAGERGVDLAIDSELPDCAVRADERWLRVMLSDLVDNAVKYTPPGGRIRIRWEQTSDVVHLCVTDTGIGIAASQLGRVFERFYRADRSRQRDVSAVGADAGGTGLGLAIVKHLAQAFGGAVDVRSRVGEGSTFVVRIPAA